MASRIYLPAQCVALKALTQPRRSIAGTERSTEPAGSAISIILAEDVVSMRRGAREGDEIVHRIARAHRQAWEIQLACWAGQLGHRGRKTTRARSVQVIQRSGG